MTVTICDLCDTEGATYCHRHHRDECDQCADNCRAGTWAIGAFA